MAKRCHWRQRPSTLTVIDFFFQDLILNHFKTITEIFTFSFNRRVIWSFNERQSHLCRYFFWSLLLLVLWYSHLSDSFPGSTQCLSGRLTALHCPQRSTGTAARLAEEDSAAAPTRAAPGGSGCWVSSSSSCSCSDFCLASSRWVSFAHTRIMGDVRFGGFKR